MISRKRFLARFQFYFFSPAFRVDRIVLANQNFKRIPIFCLKNGILRREEQLTSA